MAVPPLPRHKIQRRSSIRTAADGRAVQTIEDHPPSENILDNTIEAHTGGEPIQEVGA